jgi:Flp pilus assembly protein TadB
VKVTEVLAQTGLSEAVIDTLAATVGLTVIVIVLDVAGLPPTQAAFEVMMQDTVLPLARDALVYVGLFVPTLAPFTLHWYAGVVPPLTGVAVKVTKVPAQTGLDEAVIETLAVTIGLTVIVTVLDVAGLPVLQGAFEVITTYIASPFNGT